MFWKFNILTTQIDTLLEKEVTLSSVFSKINFNFVGCIFAGNFRRRRRFTRMQGSKYKIARLVDIIFYVDSCKICNFSLTRPENINQLIDFVVNEPAEENNEKIRYK